MRVRQLFSWTLAAVVCCAAGCDSGISSEGKDVLREGTRVEVFRVSPEPARGSAAGPAVGNYPILSTGRELGADFASRLSGVLFGSGVSANEYKCGMEPGVAFRVWRGNQCVEVLVCFKCDVLAMHLGTGDWDWEGRSLRHFGPARAKLLALCKEAFPDDPVIQGLPDVRPTDALGDAPVTQGTR